MERSRAHHEIEARVTSYVHPINRQSNGPIDIFVVEDNPGDTRLIKEAFKDIDPDTDLRTATNGSDAFDRLTEQATHEPESLPDVALVDLNLPGQDGCALLEDIRADTQLKHLPVIILTSSSAPEDVQRCYQANASAYLTKPVAPDDFETVAEQIGDFWFSKAVFPPSPAGFSC